MSTVEKISLEFGIPNHGWLPILFKFADFKLEIEISDIPLNPMTRLCDSLIQLLKGINQPEIIPWHLEPHCYYLQLKKTDTNYKVIILESKNLNSPTKSVFETNGNFKTIILPIYRSLKKFYSKAYQPPDWERIETRKIEELKRLIEKGKAHNKR